jgi:RNA polymerase sigma-70 factor (ECF subfamily)
VYESSLAITPPLPRSPGSGTTEPRLSGPGEPPGLGKLYAEYARFVAWFASRLLTRQDEVEDVVQEVFLIAARHLDSLTDPPKVRGWLKTVTLRRAARVLRWKRVRARLGMTNRSEGSDQWLASPDASPEDRVVLLELLATLERLPTDLRIAWTLRHLHEESLESVADLAGCSLATAKRRIAAAEVRLRTELQDD